MNVRRASIVLTVAIFATTISAQGEAVPEASGAPDAIPAGLTAENWAQLRAAYEDASYIARPVRDGHRAANPAQRWWIGFDGDGVTVRPEAGDWLWGLELESFGFVGDVRAMTRPEGTCARGVRVVHRWSDSLEEWYVNQACGLEHGFTVHRRPDRPAGQEDAPLLLTLGVRGNLRPEVDGDGRGVRFLGEAGDAMLTYSNLLVFDADGREFDARFERVGDRLQLSVDARDVRYPLTIDPVVMQAYVKPSVNEDQILFGESIAVSGTTAVIGAPYEDGFLVGDGFAFVFVENGVTWTQQAQLTAGNADAGDHFGKSVALSGDTIVVGASYESSNASGVNGDESDNSLSRAGAAYVFVRQGTTWNRDAYLKASVPGAHDFFGHSVALADDTVLVGACFEDSSATGVNGNDADDSAAKAGAVYVFVRTGTGWAQEAYLKASNTEADDRFGFAVALAGDRAVIGAPYEDSIARGVNGDEASNQAVQSGAVYAFSRTGTTWVQDAYLKASNSGGGSVGDPNGDFFGYAVALSGDTAVIGAHGESSDAEGVNGNQLNNSAPDAGAAYVFVHGGTSWSQEAYLKASNPDIGDWFGQHVAIDGDLIVAGAPSEDSGSSGLNGSQGGNAVLASGASYAFRREGTTWSQVAFLKASNTDALDFFGSTVGVSGSYVFVGAPDERSRATGVGGDQSDDEGYKNGAAYFYDLDQLLPSEAWYCGSGTNPDTYSIAHGFQLGGTFEAEVTFASPNTGAAIFGFAAPLSASIFGHELLVDPGTSTLMGPLLQIGTSPQAFTWPVPNEPSYAGFHVYTQAATVGGGVIRLTCAFDGTVGF